MKQPSQVILAHDKKNLKHPNKHFLYSPKTEISKTKFYIKLDNRENFINEKKKIMAAG